MNARNTQHTSSRKTASYGRGVAALLTLALFAAGCAPVLELRTDDQIHGDLVNEARDRVSVTTRVTTFDANGVALDLAVHEIGPGDRDHLFVMIHGVLSDHQGWRYIAADLGRDHDLMQIDLLGCGESDKPSPESLGPMGYGPTTMARRVLQAIQSRLNDRTAPPRKITMLAHSYGGMLAIRMMGNRALRQEFAATLDQVERLILIAPFDVAIQSPPAAFQGLVEVGYWKIELGNLLGLIEAPLTEIVASGFDRVEDAPREEATRLINLVCDRDRFESNCAILRQAVPWTEKERPDWPQVAELVEDYASIDVPCSILWGARDETLPLSMGYKLASEIPTADLWIFPHCKHSVQLERPGLCAAVIRECLNRVPVQVDQVIESLMPNGGRSMDEIRQSPALSRCLRIEILNDFEDVRDVEVVPAELPDLESPALEDFTSIATIQI